LDPNFKAEFDKGADIHAKDEVNGDTALMIATFHEKIDIVKVIAIETALFISSNRSLSLTTSLLHRFYPQSLPRIHGHSTFWTTVHQWTEQINMEAHH
jgi:hypothetical protein